MCVCVLGGERGGAGGRGCLSAGGGGGLSVDVSKC